MSNPELDPQTWVENAKSTDTVPNIFNWFVLCALKDIYKRLAILEQSSNKEKENYPNGNTNSSS